MKQNDNSVKYTYENININVTIGYCAKCLKNLDEIDKSDRKYIVRDHNGNEFCCRECRCDYGRSNREEMDDIVKNWFGNGI